MATPSIDPSLDTLLRQHHPAGLSAGCFLSLPGLSGQSVKITLPDATLVARQQPRQPLPFVDRRREYRVLKKLAAGQLVQPPLAADRHWLVQPWQAGEGLSPQTFSEHYCGITAQLIRLHRQPLTGYRLCVTSLLEQYWLLCREHHVHWLRHWRRLRQRGEPAPLRLAPVHMDLHAGNVVQGSDGYHFIDWEYSADGDIAVDLAVISMNDPQHASRWIACYARQSGISPERLARQIRHWQPWLSLLAACWYQLRAEQTEHPQLRQLARQSWQTLSF